MENIEPNLFEAIDNNHRVNVSGLQDFEYESTHIFRMNYDRNFQQGARQNFNTILGGNRDRVSFIPDQINHIEPTLLSRE